MACEGHLRDDKTVAKMGQPVLVMRSDVGTLSPKIGHETDLGGAPAQKLQNFTDKLALRKYINDEKNGFEHLGSLLMKRQAKRHQPGA
jgi:hypothetical protein